MTLCTWRRSCTRPRETNVSIKKINVFVFRVLLKPFVRALFDYNPDRDPAVPCRDAALSFKRGEILQIVCMEDVNWWQACHLKDSSGRGGLIPSQQLQERSIILYFWNYKNIIAGTTRNIWHHCRTTTYIEMLDVISKNMTVRSCSNSTQCADHIVQRSCNQPHLHPTKMVKTMANACRF